MMTRITNIQRFFGTVSADQIRRYLLDRGWKLVEPRHAEALSFELPGPPGDDPFQVWLWASEGHPSFRKRIPNVIFSLSVIEDREPLDIANDVHNLPAETSEEPVASAPLAFSFRVCHAQGEPLELRCPGSGEVLTIAPGEMIEVVVQGASPLPPSIEYQADGISIQTADSDSIELFQVAKRATDAPPPTATQIVTQQIERSGLALAESLQSDLARADFELEHVSADAAGQDTVRRQTAVLLTAVAHQLPDAAAARDVLWRIATEMIGLVGLRLRITPDARGELRSLAARDDVFSPRLTLDWLKDQAC
jgi:hypothetical protein